ncbi:thiamine diphosphate-binding protein [Marasmius fiardii PR-910]|nr:thiamine diphosphate-binding protein [Marasmius fiardii PR-910]
MVYTTSSAFLKVLSNAGITHVFVNWGSDHPALLEDLQRQRTEGDGETLPRFITCPNEMVALSAAQGYAQVTGKPAAVIVHVDVGTQALAGAIHNVDRGRAPVLIYAGASASTSRNELKGTRNEWIMWVQDVPDQPSIVRQYMRHTVQIDTGKNVGSVVNRALQIANSEPKGPVYLWARREVMEEELPSNLFESITSHIKHPPLPIARSGLSPSNIENIAEALVTAKHPFIITSHLGRNVHAVAPLLALSGLLAIPIFVTCPSALNVPFSHPYFIGITYHNPGGSSETFKAYLHKADVVVVIDCDLPWVPLFYVPKEDTRIFILDAGDPLKVSIGNSDITLHPGIELLCKADAETALEQVMDAVHKRLNESSVSEKVDQVVKTRGQELKEEHEKWVARLDAAEKVSGGEAALPSSITVPHIMSALRSVTNKPDAPLKTIFFNESISNFGFVWEHSRSEAPGSAFTSGGSSLGYALAASAGAYIGEQVLAKAQGKSTPKHDLFVAVVGDGSYMFGVPSSAFWVARRYQTPFLTIILNNGGWKSPKFSMLGVHPEGHGSRSLSGEQLGVGFRFNDEEDPDYGQIAVAATSGWAWGKRVGTRARSSEGVKLEKAFEELRDTLEEAVKVVVVEKRCAVVDVVIDLL